MDSIGVWFSSSSHDFCNVDHGDVRCMPNIAVHVATILQVLIIVGDLTLSWCSLAAHNAFVFIMARSTLATLCFVLNPLYTTGIPRYFVSW